MSGNSRPTTGSPWSKPSVSRATTSAATLRSTRTSSTANAATHSLPVRRNMPSPPARSRPVHRCPQAIPVQLGGVHLHALACTGGDHRLALVVHVQHQLLGLVPAVPEVLLEHPGDVRHEIHRI